MRRAVLQSGGIEQRIGRDLGRLPLAHGFECRNRRIRVIQAGTWVGRIAFVRPLDQVGDDHAVMEFRLGPRQPLPSMRPLRRQALVDDARDLAYDVGVIHELGAECFQSFGNRRAMGTRRNVPLHETPQRGISAPGGDHESR